MKGVQIVRGQFGTNLLCHAVGDRANVLRSYTSSHWVLDPNYDDLPLLAATLAGPADQLKLVPMLSSANQREYSRFENQARVDIGNGLDPWIDVTATDAGSTHRPTRMSGFTSRPPGQSNDPNTVEFDN